MRTLDVGTPEAARRALEEARRVLRAGGLVAFPTETVYGLLARADDPAAVARLHAAKGREPGRPCAHLLPDAEAAERLAGGFVAVARRLASRFWPGPLTLVVPGPGGEAVGLRVPDHALARRLAAEAGVPLLQSSANRAGRPAALNAAGVAQEVGAATDLLIDAGRAPGGTSSTVVACGPARYRLLREGALSAPDVAAAATRLVLTVCTGNLCRSPLAAAAFRHELAARLGGGPGGAAWRPALRFGSFGTSAMVGFPATEAMQEVAAELGLELAGHRSRPFAISLVEAADRVFVMARNHHDFLAAYLEGRPEALLPLDPKGKEIPDPYGRSLRVYRRVAARILQAVRARLDELLEEEGWESA